jgi:hypothetical protein
MGAWRAFTPRWVVLVVGVFGWLLAVDAVLAYPVALFLLATGGPVNPYVGFVLVVILPGSLAAGLVLTGWAYYQLISEPGGYSTRRAVVAQEVPGEAAVQGL